MITLATQIFKLVKLVKKQAKDRITFAKVASVLPDGFELLKLSKDGDIIKTIIKTNLNLEKAELEKASEDIKYLIVVNCKVRYINVFVLITKDVKVSPYTEEPASSGADEGEEEKHDAPTEQNTEQDLSDKPAKTRHRLANFKKVFVVASCKGGVGKSTIAFAIANGLNKAGKKVAMLDLDIYGPSIPSLIGFDGKFEVDEEKKLVPVVKNGVHYASVGFIADSDRGLVWRGPMLSKIINSLIFNCAWHQDFDALVIDMPPGTGDAHLSLFEKYIVDGICLVSTDSPLACVDLERSIDAYKSLKAPLLGLVQNMSNIFSHGLIEPLCKKHGLKILDKIDFRADLQISNQSNHTDIAVNLTEFLAPTPL